MYIPISINLDNLIEEFDLGPDQVQRLASELTDNLCNTFYSALRQNVNNKLKKTRELYLNNISINNIDDTTKEIVLTGWLPNALEEGISEFDMKEGFQNSQKVKISKEGNWYLTIPIKGNMSSVPKEIRNILNNQKTQIQQKQLSQNASLQKMKELASGKKYQNKSSIYQGMKKNEQGGIDNFRRVGENSDKNAFIHPGFEARNFFQSSLNDIENEIPILADKVIDNFLKNM